LLTTEALHRETSSLRELLEAQIAANTQRDAATRELLNAKLDEARRLSRQRYRLAREMIDARLFDHVAKSDDEKESIRREFNIVLDSMKTAVEKAELVTTTAIQTIQQVIDSKTAALESEIRGLEKRVDRDEGKGQGITTSWGIAVVLITIGLSAVAIVVALIGIP